MTKTPTIADMCRAQGIPYIAVETDSTSEFAVTSKLPDEHYLMTSVEQATTTVISLRDVKPAELEAWRKTPKPVHPNGDLNIAEYHRLATQWLAQRPVVEQVFAPGEWHVMHAARLRRYMDAGVVEIDIKGSKYFACFRRFA